MAQNTSWEAGTCSGSQKFPYFLWNPKPNIIRTIKIEKDEMDGICSKHGKTRNAYTILAGKP
jgi:hypothetical protein